MELIGHVMNYAWGKVGVRSAVAHLAALNNKDFCLDPKAPYSELWMGDHVNGPAKIKSTGDDISVVLPEPLSFLFKVLSIRQALSVQVHPNKEEAIQLHLRQPDIYKDPNHKPELAIALTPFLAMCGFRSHLQIYEICTRIRPLKAVIGEETLEKLKEETKESLQEVFKKWIYATEKQMLRCLYEINKEYRKELRIYGLLNIFKRLNRDFPNDIGVLGIFFLNVIRLAPGQSIYLGANEIHAYLEGDCIECMACSDNVIRAGLTPKFIDKKQLVQCLKYEGSPPEKKLFKPLYVDLYQTIYAPPVEDFAVVRLKLPVELGEYEWEFKPTDQILLVVHGAGKIKIPAQCREFTLRRGNIFYLPPDSGEKIIFEAIDCEDCEDDPSFALICEEEEDIGIEIEEVPGLEMQSQMPKTVEERKVKKISMAEEMCGEGGEPCNVTEPEIELCSSGFKEQDFEEGCYEEEGYEEQSSLNEKVPGKPQKRDFEVYIASANVYGTEWPYCESCVPEKDNTKRTCRQPNE